MNPRQNNRCTRWMAAACARACLVIATGLLSGMAQAQVITLSGASVFEGNAGTKVLRLPVNFIGGPNINTVTGTVSAVPMTGVGFNPATGAAVCGPGGVDFEQFTNVPFSIPPNTPNGTLSVNIKICGDTVIEPSEHIFVSITISSGGNCLDVSCGAIGAIGNDDGPPTMSINNISTSEPVAGSKTATFTVSLSHPSTQQVSVNFRTRNGTAKAACFNCQPPVTPDYQFSSGTLPIPPGAPSGPITVTILGGVNNEPDETFFVDLSAPVNATAASGGGGAGRATIRDTTLSIGGFDLSPDDARVQVGEMLNYTVDWTVPAHQVWRNLKTIDFRLRGAHETLLWLRWDEASNTFSLCHKGGGANAGHGHSGDSGGGDDGNGPGAHVAASKVVCSPGELPGAMAVLATPFARLHLADTVVIGSGPTGQVVTLKLALSLRGKSAGHHYRVELAATDDFGNQDRFVQASTLHVEKAD